MNEFDGRARFWHHDDEEDSRKAAEEWAAAEKEVRITIGGVAQQSEDDGQTWRDYSFKMEKLPEAEKFSVTLYLGSTRMHRIGGTYKSLEGAQRGAAKYINDLYDPRRLEAFSAQIIGTRGTLGYYHHLPFVGGFEWDERHPASL